MRDNGYNDRCIVKYTITALAVALIILSAPLVWRSVQENHTLPGEYSYYHLINDPIFSKLNQSFNLSFTEYWALSTILVFITLILSARLIKIHFNDDIASAVMILLFATSATTLYLASSVTPYTLSLFMILAGINLINSKHYFLHYLSIVPFAGLLLFDWLVFLCSLIIIATYILIAGKRQHLFGIATYIAAFVILNYIRPSPTVIEVFPMNTGIVELFSDLGAIHGIGIFPILLSLIGFVDSWKHKKKAAFGFVSVILMLILFLLFGLSVILFLFPVISVFSVLGFLFLLNRNWQSKDLKTFTMLILLYGILFSGMAFINRTVTLLPTEDIFESLAWLKEDTLGEMVLSHPQNGFWIKYGSNLTPFIDYKDSSFKYKLNISNEIFYSMELDKTTKLLESNGISMIWIDGGMKEGKLWKKNNEGLLFLLRDESFKKVYRIGKIDIWRYKKLEIS